MEESIFYPSPNWFLPSVLKVSRDGWLVYGGPAKSLVVLEPLSPDSVGVLDSHHRYKAHVSLKSHKDRVVSVDISPQWPAKRHFVSGGGDGMVKKWYITQEDNKWCIKIIHSHEAHANENEEVVGVSYSMSTHIVSVGSFSRLVVWELNTNTTRTYSNFMRSFKATCMSCSPHLHLVVAVGTKQGVVFVLNLNGNTGSILYKVRGQDDEISQVAWCPQYEVILKRSPEEIKKSFATLRLEKIRNDSEPSDPDASGVEKTLPEDSFDESIVVPEDDMFDIYKDHEANEFGHKKYEPEDILVKKKDEVKQDDFLAECERLKAQIMRNKEEESIETLVAAMDKAHVGNSSGSKHLEEEEKPSESKHSEEEEKSFESKHSEEEVKTVTGVALLGPSGSKIVTDDNTLHKHKHLLASVSKNGFNVRIWSKTGKVVASSVVSIKLKNNHKQFANNQPHHATLCWYKPNTLLICDGKITMVECNPLQVDCRNRLHWSVVHSSHRRGLYYIATNAPRLQTPESLSDPHCDDQWSVWTAAQDRSLVKYDMKTRRILAKFGTCGGYLYDVRPCPYDAGKISIGVGDGAVRIWESRTTGEDDNKLSHGEVTCFWQNVQGKILQCVWHPTKENLVAFSTAESRVGILDISKPDRPAKLLHVALTNGIYSLAWGEDMNLFAVGGKELVMYQANKVDLVPIPIHIEIEGQRWQPTFVNYSSRGLAVGSFSGGVALFTGPGGHAIAAKFVFTRMIQSIEWHPLQTSSSDEESPYKNLLALTSVDRSYNIIVIQLEDKEGGGKQLSDFATLSGHSDVVLKVYWSPHTDGHLLSTSQDSTVRVWDVAQGVCLSIFDGHVSGSLGAAWCAQPSLASKVLSGGSDFCLRLWDYTDYPAECYKEVKKEPRKRKTRNKNKAQVNNEDNELEGSVESNSTVNTKPAEKEGAHEITIANEEIAIEVPNVRDNKMTKRYLMPIISKQLAHLNVDGIKLIEIIQKYFANNKELKTVLEIVKEQNVEVYDLDFFKLFGSINDVNEVLDNECKAHLEVNAYRSYFMLMIFRGHIESIIQFANEHDLLDPFLLSVASSVSYKYWKDATQLYVAQIDRLYAKKHQDDETYTAQTARDLGIYDYGGPIFQKAAALLSIHDVLGALQVLEAAKLYKEAYVLCRCRHMDSIAKKILNKWAHQLFVNGLLPVSALLHIEMGNINEAVNVLRNSHQIKDLTLTAELAKSAGLNTVADFIEIKVKSAENDSILEDQTEETLPELPTRIELLMKQDKAKNGESNNEKTTDSELDGLQDKMELLMKENKAQNGESNIENVSEIENWNCEVETESKV